MKYRPKAAKTRELLARQMCGFCGDTFAAVCLFNGICSDCSTYRRVDQYGISVRDYHDTKRRQNGVCGICKRDKYLMIDHDHKSGKVRGLLCGECNTGLGHFKDSPEWLEAAIAYLLDAKKSDWQIVLQKFDEYKKSGGN